MEKNIISTNESKIEALSLKLDKARSLLRVMAGYYEMGASSVSAGDFENTLSIACELVGEAHADVANIS